MLMCGIVISPTVSARVFHESSEKRRTICFSRREARRWRRAKSATRPAAASVRIVPMTEEISSRAKLPSSVS